MLLSGWLIEHLGFASAILCIGFLSHGVLQADARLNSQRICDLQRKDSLMQGVTFTRY